MVASVSYGYADAINNRFSSGDCSEKLINRNQIVADDINQSAWRSAPPCSFE
jgi:hypothetical protein